MTDTRSSFGILNCVTEAFLVCAPAGDLLFVNSPARRLLGLGTASALPSPEKLFAEAELFRGFVASSRKSSGSTAGRFHIAATGNEIRADARRAAIGDEVHSLVRLMSVEEANLPFARINQERRLSLEAARHRAARRMLEKSHASLEGFAATAAHDLKAPARRISMLTGMMLEQAAEAPGNSDTELLQLAQSNAVRLMDTVDAIHRYSRAGSRKMETGECDLAEVMTEARASLIHEMQEHSARLEVGRLPGIRADRAFLLLLFQNLLQNALKFRRRDVPPVIRLEAARGDDQSVEIAFSDNGIGFEPAQAEHIFAPFKRLHGSEIEGTGLGLSTCMTIIERHGWTIAAEGIPDAGATFRIQVPSRDIVRRERRQQP